ncbi:hypothetical protein T484DRAFT_1755930 [Baffinella frigidus]|nr:hypothetical protein T484DRAFT_1755930 [Cryptophyta sp. CCMP2293]
MPGIQHLKICLISTALLLSVSWSESASLELSIEVLVSDDNTSTRVLDRLHSGDISEVYLGVLKQYVVNFNGTLLVEDAVLQPMEPPALSAAVPLDTSDAHVEQVVKDSSTATWVVTIAYRSAQNTFISPFMSRRVVLAESPQLFNASGHPCRKMRASICCLVDYNANYHTGTAFSRFVDNTIGRRCAGNGTQATNITATFEHPDENSFITGALDGVPGSVVEASGGGVVTMRVPAVSMDAYVARARAGGADLVVGVNFITIWEHRVVSMTVKQFNLRLDDASSSIAVTPQNGVSSTHLPVASIHISVEQTKYVENVVDLGNNTAYPQSAVIKIALGGGSSPADSSTHHWGIPVESIRWSIHKSATPPASDAVWVRSCSRDLYDTAQETLYTQVISQKCANHDARTVGMCDTFVPELMAGIPGQMTGLQGSIHVPLGIATVSKDMIAGRAYSLFVQYDVWTTDEGGVGETTVSTVHNQLLLTNTSVSLLCANISIEDKLDEITDMDMSVGVATTSDDFTRKVLVRRNMISRASEGETATAIFNRDKVVHNASSYADGLISIILTGTDAFFGSTSCRLFIEDLWTVHTQNTAHTAQVLRAFRSGHAFVATHSYNHVDVTPHETLVDICNGLLCAYRHDIQNHKVLNEYAVHEHGGPSGVFDEADTRAWLQDHIFGPTYADRLTADRFTALFRVGGGVTGFAEIDDRYNKLYHLNPTHRWRDDTRAPMDPYNPLLLSDAVFVYAVIAFEDGSNVTQHRTVSTGTAYEINSGAPTSRPQLPVSIIKTASNSPLQTQVNAMMAIAREVPVPDHGRRLLGVTPSRQQRQVDKPQPLFSFGAARVLWEKTQPPPRRRRTHPRQQRQLLESFYDDGVDGEGPLYDDDGYGGSASPQSQDDLEYRGGEDTSYDDGYGGSASPQSQDDLEYRGGEDTSYDDGYGGGASPQSQDDLEYRGGTFRFIGEDTSYDDGHGGGASPQSSAAYDAGYGDEEDDDTGYAELYVQKDTERLASRGLLSVEAPPTYTQSYTGNGAAAFFEIYVMNHTTALKVAAAVDPGVGGVWHIVHINVYLDVHSLSTTIDINTELWTRLAASRSVVFPNSTDVILVDYPAVYEKGNTFAASFHTPAQHRIVYAHRMKLMVLYAENATLTPPTIGTIECVIWYGLNASLYMVRDESGATRCERTPVGAPTIQRTIGGALVIKAETNTCGVAVELAHCPPTPVTHAEHTNATLKMELVEFVDSMFAPLLTIPSNGSELFEYVGVLIAVISTLGSIGGLICRRKYHKTYVSIHQYAPQDGHVAKKPDAVKAPELVVPILQVKTAFTRNQPKTTNLGRTYNV